MFANLKTFFKEKYYSFLSDSILYLGQKKIKIDEQINKSSINLEDLTPFLSVENENNTISKTYVESLKWGILNSNVKNIALSGSFGTGKSTILNLFKKIHPEFKTIDINLGKFEEKTEQKEFEIETSIVQQILYFEKKGNLNESKVERIRVQKFTLFKTLCLIIWIYCLLFLFFKNVYNKLVLFDIKFINDKFYEFCIKSIFILITIYIAKNLFSQISNLKLNKISFKDVELIPKGKEISIINQHIDELLYFFEKTKTRVVFIEDIDRFENALDIFIKLRELNILINNSKDIDDSVTFVYAVKDELFSKNTDRTKFFDLIIPIIPVIDFSNSSSAFISKLKTDFIEKKILSEDIILNISPYINDMRTLINIINEFKVYYKIQTLQTDLDAEKLFGLIVLKNIYPAAFKELQNKSGIVYNVFRNINNLYDQEFAENKKIIDELNLEIKHSIEEKIEDVKDLRKIYIYELLKFIPNAKIILEEGTTFINLTDDNKFITLINSESISYSDEPRLYSSYKTTLDKTFKDIENIVDDQFSYKERERFITNRNENIIQEKKIAIAEYEAINLNIKNNTFFEFVEKLDFEVIEEYYNNIITKEEKKNFINKEELESKDNLKISLDTYNLLKVLISNNYINENYSSYISLFYPESLSYSDNNLKMQIIENKTLQFESKIENAEKLVAELAPNNFTKESILNHHILESLLRGNNSSEFKKNKNIATKLNGFIRTISNYNDVNVKFINDFIKYFEKDKDLIYLFIIEISEWENFWDMVYIKNEYEIETKKLILDYTFIANNIQELKNLNKTKKLNAFLNNYDDFLLNNFENFEKKDLIDKLKSLGVKFNKIKYKEELFEFLVEIYENNLYKINISNVDLILTKLNNVEINLDKRLSNYSYLLKSDCSYLKTNVENNINEYIEQVLLKLEKNTEEETKNVILLLNNEDIKLSNREKLLDKLEFKVENIDEIEDKELWTQLLNGKKIEPRWKNLLLEYEDHDDDFTSIEVYLNEKSNYEILSHQCINDFLTVHVDDEEEEEEEEEEEKKGEIQFPKEIIEEFNLALINSKITENSFNNLVKSLTFNILDITKIKHKSRISTLIENRLIKFNKENLENIPAEFKKLFIEKNEPELSENYSIYGLDKNTWDDILKTSINSSIKENIFKYLDEMKIIQINDKDLLQTIIANFKDANFHFYSKDFTDLAMKSNITQEEKIFLFNLEFSNFSILQTQSYLDVIGNPFTKINNKEIFEVKNTPINLEFFKNIQSENMIRRVYLKDNDSNIKVSY